MSISKRWQWNKILGESGNKYYDYVILVGDADHRYRSLYTDSSSPYVLFCIPRSDVATIAGGTRYKSILLGTNPRSLTSKKSLLIYERYQVTHKEMADR